MLELNSNNILTMSITIKFICLFDWVNAPRDGLVGLLQAGGGKEEFVLGLMLFIAFLFSCSL